MSCHSPVGWRDVSGPIDPLTELHKFAGLHGFGFGFRRSHSDNPGEAYGSRSAK